MKKVKLSFLLVCGMLIFACAITFAQPPAPGPGPKGKAQGSCPYLGNPGNLPPGPPPPSVNVEEMFKRADKNADGYLDLEEFKSARKEVRKSDKAYRGKGDGGEMGQGRKEMRGAGGGSGADVQAKREQRLIEMFKRIDKDADGKISLEEFKASPLPAPPMPPRPPHSGPGPIPPAPPKGPQMGKPEPVGPPQVAPRGVPSPGGKWISEVLREADKDNDGKVTFDELKSVKPNMTEERFKFMDVNNDGVITKEDLEQWREKVKDKMKEADVDKDGKLSKEEVRKIFPRMTDEAFQRKDINGDGFLTPDELRSGFGPMR